METHDLIGQLAKEAKPVKPLATPERRFILWSVSTILFFLAGMALLGLGLRANFFEVIFETSFLIETTVALGVAALSGLSAFILSVPGEERGPWTRWIPLAVTGVWVAFIGWRLLSAEPGAVAYHMTHGNTCAQMILLLSIVPSLSFFWMLKKASPLRNAWSGGLALLSVGALGSVAAQFFCRGTHAAHTFFWHFCPCLLMAGIGVGLGALVLKFALPKRKKSV